MLVRLQEFRNCEKRTPPPLDTQARDYGRDRDETAPVDASINERKRDDMTISPVALGLGLAGGVGLGSTIAMARSGKEDAQKIRQGTTIFGLTTAGVTGLMAMGGGIISEASWATGAAKFTGMTKAGQWGTVALGFGAGVAAANAAAEWVLDINDNSLAGS